MSTLNREQLRANIIGLVQGVGYRYFALSAGRRLNLSGYARNCPDGSVEVVAEGPREALLQLVGALRQGPPAARVEDVRFTFTPATYEYEGFHVKQ